LLIISLRQQMLKTLLLLFRSMRPRQWTKNLAVFAPIIFTGKLFDFSLLLVSLKAFVILCVATSSIYLINDIIDLPHDRLHPFKKGRPIAAGLLDEKLALWAAVFGIFLSLEFAYLVSYPLFFMTLIFLLLQLSYSLFFKNLPQFDILIIAAAYTLRVYMGEIVTGYYFSVWLMLAVVSLSLFLATGKRRAELTLLTGGVSGKPIPKTRATLIRYKEALLDIYTSIFATSTFITYGFYTFSETTSGTSSGSIARSLGRILPELVNRKWLMITLPFVLYGILRYLQLIYEKGEGESPERILYRDIPLSLTILLWGVGIVVIIYFF